MWKTICFICLILLVFSLSLPFLFSQSNNTIKLRSNLRLKSNDTIYTINRTLLVNSFSFPSGSLKLPIGTDAFWVNVTSGDNPRITINNWFDQYGTELEITSSGNYILQLYVGDKDKPNDVYGASWSWNSATSIVTLSVSNAPKIVSVHWQSGATTRLVDASYSGHRSLG